MRPAEAVSSAKRGIAELFVGESIQNLGLEEIEYSDDERVWHITLGFSRPWDDRRGLSNLLGADALANRHYRVVKVRDEDGAIISVKLRELN
ncbi:MULTISPECIES: hypothetical protein [unclassified Aureimonas]|uniref:hypothetical protein n=1 Tax=unclassified Aureimonas TaxID=2615206 RepID=UPI0006F916CF|nr:MULTISPECIES: hypothetical protein [unclassified Aureimonas]KQT52817.1 hypothetical protein ASG62_12895 [Aureimonas sp. Leaf427]